MSSVSVQLGLLAIAKDWAHADLKDVEAAKKLATDAGHRIVVQQVLGDTEGGIRDTLRRWIDDAEVDAIIVLGGAESDTISAALKPLVTAPLQGFSDLFRWLMFQEQGASAMLSSAEAARCTETFVFVLPGAIGPAMEKLILPQFDSTSTGKNLLGQMPRLREASGGVPTAVPPEKTQGGSGMKARPPAVSAGSRAAPTGPHVVSRKMPNFDPETAPIDLERLEKDIAASLKPHEDSTRPTDLAKLLPKLPPGADPDDDDEYTRADAVAPPPRGPRAPGAAVTINPRKRTEGSKDAPNAKASPSKNPTVQAPVVPPPKKPVVPADPRARRPSSLPPIEVPARLRPTKAPPLAPASLPSRAAPPPSDLDDADTGVKLKAVAPVRAAAPRKTPPKILTDKTVSGVTPDPAYQTTSVPLQDEDMEPVETLDSEMLKTDGFIRVEPEDEAPTSRATPRPAPAKRPPTEPPPAPKKVLELSEKKTEKPTEKPTEKEAEKKLADAIEAAPAKKLEAKPEPAAEPAKAAVAVERPTAETTRPKSESASPRPKSDSASPRPRSDSAPPPARRPSAELPRGMFNYPEQKRGLHPAVKVIGFLAIAAAGFGAFVVLAGRDDKPAANTAAPVASNDAMTGSAPPPPATDVQPLPDDTEPEPIEMDATRIERPVRNRPPVRTPGPSTGPTTRPDTGPAVTSPPPDAAAAVAVPAGDDCDEQSCVMNNYDKPCCARYKPTAKPPEITAPTPASEPTDGITRPQVMTAMNGVKARVTTCGEKNSAKGTVKVKVTVSPAGAVTGTDVVDAPDSALGACVSTAIKTAKFPSTEKGGSFTYPFVF